MKLLGLEKIPALIQRTRARLQTFTAAAMGMSAGWYGVIREGFTGAWQQGVVLDSQKDILSFSAVFSSVTIIANDISKLYVCLKKKGADGVGVEAGATEQKKYKVLRKPNHYQNRMAFFLHWMLSKLLYGNTYVLKARDQKGNVVELYVLDPQRVAVLVATSGDVYYRLARDDLSGLHDSVVVPASEIIHDLMNPLWHPLIGVSPIYACALSATMGNRIQKNSSKFFLNMSRPSGALSAPGTIDDVTANRMKEEWEKNFGGENIGRLAVLGDGLKYEAMTIPANEAQLIEQLRWTVEDVARCFHLPVYKIGGSVPPNTSIAALNQGYYSDCLQSMIESAELCLDDGLELEEYELYTEFDLEGLLRMDPQARYEAKGKAVKDGWMSPNEARKGEDLPAVAGGESCYLQQQNFSLSALAKRDAQEDPFATTPKKPPAESEPDEPIDLNQFAEKFARGLEAQGN